jgi:hypothetical protein
MSRRGLIRVLSEKKKGLGVGSVVECHTRKRERDRESTENTM